MSMKFWKIEERASAGMGVSRLEMASGRHGRSVPPYTGANDDFVRTGAPLTKMQAAVGAGVKVFFEVDKLLGLDTFVRTNTFAFVAEMEAAGRMGKMRAMGD